MANFMVSAPGKAILYGEHAVIYGKTAIAASISLRTYLLVSELSNSARTIRLNFPDIGLDREWSIDDLPWKHFASPLRQTPDESSKLNKLAAIESQTAYLASIQTPEELRKAQHAAASAFLYLYLSLFQEENARGCVYTLRSEIPVGAGLGSSSSMAVCISSALLLQSENIPLTNSFSPNPDATTRLMQINECAFIAEKFVHGNPSGIDNTISTRGGAIRFKRNLDTESISAEILEQFPDIGILLVNTRQPRSTRVEVEKVRRFKTKYPVIANDILGTIGKITDSASLTLKRAEICGMNIEMQQQLGELLHVNHSLLVSLGVSHPKIERVRHLIDDQRLGWTKLTGAGGGGCTISIIRPGTSQRRLEVLEAQIEAEGFEQCEVTIGGPGVGLVWLENVATNDRRVTGTHELAFLARFREASKTGLGKRTEEYILSQGLGWKFWTL